MVVVVVNGRHQPRQLPTGADDLQGVAQNPSEIARGHVGERVADDAPHVVVVLAVEGLGHVRHPALQVPAGRENLSIQSGGCLRPCSVRLG